LINTFEGSLLGHMPDDYNNNIHGNHNSENNKNEIVYFFLKIGKASLRNTRELRELNIVSFG